MESTTFLDAQDIPEGTVFQKGSRSGAAGHCVEVAAVADGVALRHSKDQGRGAFLFTREEMGAFVQGAKDGEFDDLVG